MANIGDVARHLGISRSTVSYAMSGKRPVSAEMKARIDAAIRELDYFPSAAGLSLATSRRNIIGLLAPLAENATPSVALQFVNGVARASRTHGLDTLLVTGREAFDGVERLVRGAVVDGLVVLDVEEDDPRVAALTSARLPAVLVGRPATPVELDTIDLEWGTVGADLARQLVELGHREVLLLGAPEVAHEMGMTYAVRFRDGVRNVLAGAGVTLVELPTDVDFATTLDSIVATLVAHPGITGVIVQHESAAPPLLAAAGALRLRIPQDLSAVGITLDVIDPTMGRPLSGVSTPSVEITRRAVDMLVDRLSTPGRDAPARAVVVDGVVQDRGTTAPAPPVPAARQH